MTLGELIIEARLHRRKVLDAQLRALMTARDEMSGPELAAWDAHRWSRETGGVEEAYTRTGGCG